MQTLLQQMWILVFVGIIGVVNAFADEARVKKILDDPDLFSREAVNAIRDRSKALAEAQESAILSIRIQGGPSLDAVEDKYGKSDSTIDSLPTLSLDQRLSVYWYGNLGFAVPQGNKERPIVALFVEGPEELP